MKPLILIVDDDPLVCKLFTVALEKHGYAVHTEFSGQAALEYLQDNAVDLMLLDVMMSDMDGLDVINRIRNTDRYPDIPILVLSARADTITKYKGLLAGATDYLYKPVAPDVLIENIQALLAADS